MMHRLSITIYEFQIVLPDPYYRQKSLIAVLHFEATPENSSFTTKNKGYRQDFATRKDVVDQLPFLRGEVSGDRLLCDGM